MTNFKIQDVLLPQVDATVQLRHGLLTDIATRCVEALSQNRYKLPALEENLRAISRIAGELANTIEERDA